MENLWRVSYQVDDPTFSKLQVLLLVVAPEEAIAPRPSSDAKIRHFKGLATSEQLSSSLEPSTHKTLKKNTL